jgi:uncharacterized protein YjbI with pentapeptide repeats
LKHPEFLDKLRAWDPVELAEQFAKGVRDFSRINLLRTELAEILATHTYLDAWVYPDSRHNPLWDDYKLQSGTFEWDSYGRFLIPEDLPPPRSLTSMDLAGINLEGSYLYPVNFGHSDLSQANLKRAVFIDCDLSSVKFSRADLRDAQFHSCCLNDADFYMARMDRVLIAGEARGANFSRAKLARAHIAGDLRNSNWNHAHCRATWIIGDLRGIDLSRLDSAIVTSSTINPDQLQPLLRLLGIRVV